MYGENVAFEEATRPAFNLPKEFTKGAFNNSKKRGTLDSYFCSIGSLFDKIRHVNFHKFWKLIVHVHKALDTWESRNNDMMYIKNLGLNCISFYFTEHVLLTYIYQIMVNCRTNETVFL